MDSDKTTPPVLRYGDNYKIATSIADVGNKHWIIGVVTHRMISVGRLLLLLKVVWVDVEDTHDNSQAQVCRWNAMSGELKSFL